MSEDYWYIKAAVALLCLCALIYDTIVPQGLIPKLALVAAIVILALDARRDRARDFWRSLY